MVDDTYQSFTSSERLIFYGLHFTVPKHCIGIRQPYSEERRRQRNAFVFQPEEILLMLFCKKNHDNFKIALDLELTPRGIVQLQMTDQPVNSKEGDGNDN